jgi:hypothetical protein
VACPVACPAVVLLAASPALVVLLALTTMAPPLRRLTKCLQLSDSGSFRLLLSLMQLAK